MTDAEKIKKLENEIENLKRQLSSIADQVTFNFNKIHKEFDDRLKSLEEKVGI